MRGIGSVRGLRGAVLVRGLRGSPARFDGFGGFQGGGGAGGNSGPSGVVPGGGGVGGGGPGTPPPALPPPPAPGPQTQPGQQPPPGTAPSPGAGGPGQFPPQPGALPGQQPPANPNAVPQPGQQTPPGPPQNPFAALPANVQAYVQQLQRAAQQWDQNRFFAQLGYQQWQAAQAQQQTGGRGGPQLPPGQGGFPGQPQGQLLPPAPQPPANPFNVPRFDMANLAMIRRNPETGQYEAHPNAPPGLAQQADAYHTAVVNATHNFFQDPEKYLGDIVRRIAGEVAEQRSQQQLGQFQNNQFAQQTLQQNADWLYERDAAGHTVQDFDMRTGEWSPRLSAWGNEYARRVYAMRQSGVTDGRMLHQLAMEGLKNLAYQLRDQQQQLPAGQQPQGQQFLQQGQQHMLPGQQVPPVVPQQQPPGQLPPPGPGTPGRRMSLREELGGVYTAHGFTDQAIAQGVQGGFGAGFSALNGVAA